MPPCDTLYVWKVRVSRRGKYVKILVKKKLSLFVTAQKKACRVSVSPASILVPCANHPQRQHPSSPRPVPPTALSTHQAPSPLPVPFFFLLTLPLTSSSSSSPSSPILLPQATKVRFLAHAAAPRAPPSNPQPGRPNPSSEQSP